MVLPTIPGSTISLDQIRVEFGGTTPVYMSNYYAGGSLVPAGVPGIPTSGMISMSQFSGVSKVTATPATGVVSWVARLAGGAGSDVGNSICATSDGGVAVTGWYAGNLTAYNANQTAFTTTLIYIGNASNSFVTKYNSDGVVQWTARVAGTGADLGRGVCALSDGSIVVAGYYTSNPITAYNANQSAFATTIANGGSNDGFIVSYSAAGVVQWIARIGGTGDDVCYAITSTSDNSIVATGYYTGQCTAYNADKSSFQTNLATIGGNDVLITKYSSSGFAQWVARLGTSAGSDHGRSICSTTDGGIAVMGYYVGTLIAYNANQSAFASTLSQTGSVDSFLAKYSSTGTVQWIVKVTSTLDDFDFGVTGVTDGGIVMIGYYTTNATTAYNADGTGFATVLPATSGQDTFIAKYSTNGFVEWIARLGGTGNEQGYGICSTNDGGMVATGLYSSSQLTVYNANQTAFSTLLANSGSFDIFLAKYTSSGSVLWVSRLGGTFNDQGFGVCSTTDGGVVATGQYQSAPFTAYNATQSAFATTMTISSGGGFDVFLVKYK